MTYYLVGNDTEAEIHVPDGHMIVYDVCKMAEYQGADYLPRKARELPHHMLSEMFHPKDITEKEESND